MSVFVVRNELVVNGVIETNDVEVFDTREKAEAYFKELVDKDKFEVEEADWTVNVEEPNFYDSFDEHTSYLLNHSLILLDEVEVQ